MTFLGTARIRTLDTVCSVHYNEQSNYSNAPMCALDQWIETFLKYLLKPQASGSPGASGGTLPRSGGYPAHPGNGDSPATSNFQ